MNTSNMPGCCAVRLITNFGHTTTNEYDSAGEYKPTVEEVSEYLRERTTYDKMYTCFINEEQRKAIGAALRKNGFKRTSKFHHPSHNSTVYQYTKINDNLKLKK